MQNSFTEGNLNFRIDLHMHTRVSDGTDTPEEILELVKKSGLSLFSVTDHDALKGCNIILDLMQEGDPRFVTGVEFSCKDEKGSYHILGYGYDPDSEPMKEVIRTGHRLRMKKLNKRLEFLDKEFGFRFSEKDVEELHSLDNPGKPHIGNLMVGYGYAESKDQAIKEYINQFHVQDEYVRPEEAIRGILGGGGIPILAHPSYGNGDQLILGKEMEQRIRFLLEFGLQGLEIYYSGFTTRIRRELLGFADRFDLYVTAGSDYHGGNKLIELGETGLDSQKEWPDGLKRFLNQVRYTER